MTDDPSSWMFVREPFVEATDTDDPVEVDPAESDESHDKDMRAFARDLFDNN